MSSIFETREPNIADNALLRIPQRKAFKRIKEHYSQEEFERETSIILPVGCGKSGLITLTPFAVKSKKSLVIAPGLNITSQLLKDFDPSREGMFYSKCSVLDGPPYPEPAEIRGNKTNRSDLDEAEVVYNAPIG